MLRNLFLVGLGGAAGAMLRYGVTLACQTVQWSSNLATFLVNIIGSFAMGWLVSSCPQPFWLLLTTTGLCGGFTTFSTFSLQSVTLLQQGRYVPAALYILGTVVLCLTFAAAGCYAGQHIGTDSFSFKN